MEEKDKDKENERRAKIKFLFKLADAGFDNEKAIERLEIADLPKISGFALADIGLIVQLQRALKEKKLIEFLTGKDETTCADES